MLLPYDGMGPLTSFSSPAYSIFSLKTSPVQEDYLAFLQPALSCFTVQGYLVPVALSRELV